MADPRIVLASVVVEGLKELSINDRDIVLHDLQIQLPTATDYVNLRSRGKDYRAKTLTTGAVAVYRPLEKDELVRQGISDASSGFIVFDIVEPSQVASELPPKWE